MVDTREARSWRGSSSQSSSAASRRTTQKDMEIARLQDQLRHQNDQLRQQEEFAKAQQDYLAIYNAQMQESLQVRNFNINH